jgi:hypothetical protein
MKRLLLIFIFLGISQFLYSQTIIGSVKRGPFLIAELSVNKTDSSDVFKLRYLDASTDLLKSTLLKVNQSKIEELYIFFSKMMEGSNGSSGDFQIGNATFNATTQKMVGFKNILITINESANFGLNQKEINKLFGK